MKYHTIPVMSHGPCFDIISQANWWCA